MEEQRHQPLFERVFDDGKPFPSHPATTTTDRATGNRTPFGSADNGLNTSTFGFYFRPRREKLNWRLLDQMDLERVVEMVDIDALESVLQNITFAHLHTDELRCISETSLLKLFRFCQLIIEYLLHVQTFLSNKKGSMERDVRGVVEEIERYRTALEKKNEETSSLKKEIKRLKRTQFAYEVVFGANPEKARITANSIRGAISGSPPEKLIETNLTSQPLTPNQVSQPTGSNNISTLMETLQRDIGERTAQLTLLATRMAENEREMLRTMQDREDASRRRSETQFDALKQQMDRIQTSLKQEMANQTQTILTEEKRALDLAFRDNRSTTLQSASISRFPANMASPDETSANFRQEIGGNNTHLSDLSTQMANNERELLRVIQECEDSVRRRSETQFDSLRQQMDKIQTSLKQEIADHVQTILSEEKRTLDLAFRDLKPMISPTTTRLVSHSISSDESGSLTTALRQELSEKNIQLSDLATRMAENERDMMRTIQEHDVAVRKHAESQQHTLREQTDKMLANFKQELNGHVQIILSELATLRDKQTITTSSHDILNAHLTEEEHQAVVSAVPQYTPISKAPFLRSRFNHSESSINSERANIMKFVDEEVRHKLQTDLEEEEEEETESVESIDVSPPPSQPQPQPQRAKPPAVSRKPQKPEVSEKEEEEEDQEESGSGVYSSDASRSSDRSSSKSVESADEEAPRPSLPTVSRPAPTQTRKPQQQDDHAMQVRTFSDVSDISGSDADDESEHIRPPQSHSQGVGTTTATTSSSSAPGSSRLASSITALTAIPVKPKSK